MASEWICVGLAASALVLLAAFLMVVVYFGNKAAARGRESGRLQAHRKQREEDEALSRGLQHVASLSVCTRCGQRQDNPVIGSSQDGGGSVDLHYCDEAFHYTQYMDWPVTSEMYIKTRAKLIAIGRWRTRPVPDQPAQTSAEKAGE